MGESTENKGQGPHPWVRPLLEFAIVAGLCALAYFVVIPAGTVESDNFGLSPRLLPTVTIVAIAILSLMTLVVDLSKAKSDESPAKTTGLFGVAMIVLATLCGVVAINWLGIVAGGVLLVVMISLAIGERRPLPLLASAGIALAVLSIVEWSGL